MTGIVVDANTTLQQSIASDPESSAWVSANAGSGKTHVLTQRIVRLLLSGTDPARILALTFTKAAAGEMSIRVFETLGKWVTMSEEDLKETLHGIEGKQPAKAQLERARTLFARALETPGGLKIQTIHAFCEALLHQFPLEANIPGNFSVMDDAAQAAALADAQTSIVLEADEAPASSIGNAFAKVMDAASDHQIEKVFKEIISNRVDLYNWLEKIGGAEEAEAMARKRFQFPPDSTPDELAQSILDSLEVNNKILREISEYSQASGKKKGFNWQLAQRIDAYLNQTNIQRRLESYEKIFLSSEEPRKYSHIADAKLKAEFPEFESILEAEAIRLGEARKRLNTLKLITVTTPMMIIAQAIINYYRRTKRDQGLLDYDDLVARTADLLTRSDARRWVLYKLDLGIDHILVDEAQDTSPRQWQIIASLVSEFFAGESARPTKRTVFAVGDEKQSIYSFQGARPESFATHRALFGRMAKDVEQDLENVSLGLSFRSTQDVLSAVDKVFSVPDNADGLSFGGELQTHTAARRKAVGKVDIWALEEPEIMPEPESVDQPQPQMHNGHQAIKLANKIAQQIKTWVRADGVDPGSILVLVRARDRFMVAINRALKDLNLPVAGADRLALTDHIAVKDLLALGQVMLTPDDDLSLAALLKSPLFGLSEEALYSAARNRLKEKYEISLFDSLEELNGQAPFDAAFETLSTLRARVDTMPAYEFYARLLGADGGRKKFYSRLGAEAEDVLDAFLDLTLKHEQGGLPGLQAFIESLQREAPEIKREMDQSTGQVRVMTVHAAKGLEAPIVFLVDKCSPAFLGNHASALHKWGDSEENGYLWVPKTEMHGDATLDSKAQEKLLAEQEYRRLLYVAMTRARDHLIVCGYKGEKAPSLPNWHQMVSSTLGDTAEPVSENGFDFLRWQHDPSARNSDDLPSEPSVEKTAIAPNQLPDWVNETLPRETRLPRPLSPSGAHTLIEEGLAKEVQVASLLDGIPEEQSMSPRKRGTAIHVLLQLLPELPDAERWQKGEVYLERALPEFSQVSRSNMLDGVRDVLTSPSLKAYFDPLISRAEVPVLGQIDLASGPRSVSGTIDRMAVLDDHIMLMDYKTSAYAPTHIKEVSHSYITQMALYRAMIEKLYPTKTIRCSLIWTHAHQGPDVMEVPKAMMEDALKQIAHL